MKTLQITDGDLVLNSGSYGEVTGEAKLTQDLALALREPLGSDRFHTRWGSQLDRLLGHPITPELAQKIKWETERVVDNYMAVQRDNINRDATIGSRSRYGTGEVVNQVKEVLVRQQLDSFHVKVVLTTLTGNEVALITTVRN